MTMQEFYDTVVWLARELEAAPVDPALGRQDPQVVKALAATYELQEFLANELAAEGDLDLEVDQILDTFDDDYTALA